MFTFLVDWLDHRVGVRKLVSAMLLEGVPGGARWRYVWGSCLAFVFSIQLITGLLLMTAYSPSSTDAWSSVHFIQYKMDFGWLIRGLHHFGSQTMMVLIALHMLQVVIAGAQLPPREVNWWLGMGLFGVVFGLSLTGYLLPWDQKGFWATRVATNIANNIPGIGSDIRQILVGGEDYGNHTLTRFYGLHVAVLPGTLIVLLILHIVIFRRHGVTSKANVEGLVTKPENEHAPGSEPFYPRQAFYDMVACMAVFGVMLALVFFPHEHDGKLVFGHGHPVNAPAAPGEEPSLFDYWAKAGQRGLGANLDAAADRETANYPARPEWYFLFLFQLLKYFPGDQVLIGTVFIPNGVAILLLALPLFGYGPFRMVGYFLGILVVVTLLALVSMLTAKALMDDAPDGILWGLLKNSDPKDIEKAKKFHEHVEEADELAQRACQLAMNGSPVEGGHLLLRNDPLTAGRKSFEKNCGSCHSFSANKDDPFPSWTKGHAASDLGAFATEPWIRGLLKNPMADEYFGLVKKVEEDGNGKKIAIPALTGMRSWRKRIDNMRKDKEWKQDQIDAQEKDFDLIAKWLAHQRTPKDLRDPKLMKDGLIAFQKEVNRCSGCHTYNNKEDGGGADGAPDLTDYGSAEWIRGMIMRPGNSSRYGVRNQMPAFRDLDAGPGAELSLQEFRETNPSTPANKILDLPAVQREVIIRWMLRDYRPVFGGSPIK